MHLNREAELARYKMVNLISMPELKELDFSYLNYGGFQIIDFIEMEFISSQDIRFFLIGTRSILNKLLLHLPDEDSEANDIFVDLYFSVNKLVDQALN